MAPNHKLPLRNENGLKPGCDGDFGAPVTKISMMAESDPIGFVAVIFHRPE